MDAFCTYASPVGIITLASSGDALSGAWFEGHKHGPNQLPQMVKAERPAVLEEALRWLDDYFSGAQPTFRVPLLLRGTEFQRSVWQILLSIPYGQTTTYGEIAARIAAQKKLVRMSAQAVGGAVGRNPVSIFVPCHRVLGAGSRLTGYAGGVGRKAQLLALEGITPPSMCSSKKSGPCPLPFPNSLTR